MSAARSTAPDLTEARVINWARWARMNIAAELGAVWCPETGLSWPEDRSEVYGVPGDSGDSCDEFDAEEVEAAMLELKRHRPRLYAALRERYVRRRDDLTAAGRLRMPVAAYGDACAAGLRWLRRVLG